MRSPSRLPMFRTRRQPGPQAKLLVAAVVVLLVGGVLLLRPASGPPQTAPSAAAGGGHRWQTGQGPTRWVVFSTNENPFYSFFAPLTTWVWVNRIGFRPLVLVSEAVPQLVREAVEWAGGDVLEVPQGGWPTSSTLLQVARVVAAAAIEADDDVLTTGDVDMFPLGVDYFTALNASEADVHVQGNHPATLPREYPICYVTMRVATWKRIMGTGSTRDLGRPMAALLRKELPWNYDQTLLLDSVRGSNASVKLYPWFNSRRMDFRLDVNRLPTWQEGYIDAHLLRPGFTRANWPRLKASLLAHVIAPDALAYFEGYRKRFVAEVMRGDDVAAGLVDGLGRPN